MTSKRVSEPNLREFPCGRNHHITQSKSYNYQNKKPLKLISNRSSKYALISKTTMTSHLLNVPLQTEIYKNLIPVNVNNSVLEDIYPKKKKQRPSTQKSKDPEPALGDFLMPIKPLELKIEKCDIQITLSEIETFSYNRFYELFKALNIDF